MLLYWSIVLSEYTLILYHTSFNRPIYVTNVLVVTSMNCYKYTMVYLTNFGWIIVTHNYQPNRLLTSNLKCNIFLFFSVQANGMALGHQKVWYIPCIVVDVHHFHLRDRILEARSLQQVICDTRFFIAHKKHPLFACELK